MKIYPPEKYIPGMWSCRTCHVEIPISQNDRIVAHLHTKTHKKYERACPRCRSLRMEKIKGECWDRDGIREAIKCARCNTEYKSFAANMSEKDRSEYTGEWPQHIKDEEEKEFHERALRRGYAKA